MSKLSVLNPVAAKWDADFIPSKRPETLAGLTVGLVWNGKPGGNVALKRLAQHIKDRYGEGVKFVDVLDDFPFSRATIDRVIRTCNVAIGATGD